MAAITEFKCPNCSGAIEFDSSTQNMKCPYCDSEFDVAAVEAANQTKTNSQQEINWGEAGSQWETGETDGMKVYLCNSCGGEIIADETTSATRCPYCDNVVTVKGNFDGGLRPDLIIPFKLDKEAAKKAYLNHISGKKFLPKLFKEQNHIDEIKGVYVPHWIFDCKTNADLMYDATKSRTWSDSNFVYTETSHYALYRSGSVSFNGIPVDGSTKMDDALMESIEPFNLNDAVDFKSAYLAGYLADKYDVTYEDGQDRINERIRMSLGDLFSDSSGYDKVQLSSVNMSVDNGAVKYALYPVWILNTTYKGQKYVFAMNGQTGKMVGNLPIDKGAFWKTFSILGAGISVAMYIIILLFFR